MPILLDDLNAAVSQISKIYSPKFFDSELTGKGKKTGLLNEMRNPVNIPLGIKTTADNIDTSRRKTTNGDTDVNYIPVNVLTAKSWASMYTTKKPDDNLLTTIGEFKQNTTTPHITVQLYMPVHSLIFEKTATPAGGYNKKLTTCYQIMLFFTIDNNVTDYYLWQDLNSFKYNIPSDNIYHYVFNCDPVTTLNSIIDELSSYGFDMDYDAILDFIAKYSLYDGVVARVQEWNETIDKTLDIYFKNISNSYSGNAVNDVAFTLRRLENYNIPLDLYRNIYTSIKKHFTKRDDASKLCKQNLNLLLSDTLHNLNTNKPLLTSMPVPNTPVTIPNFSQFSPEQQKAISSTDPLILVQAGAGTGKALPLNELILTPTGWTTMGELKVGDEIIGSNGLPTKVLRIHEQGLKPGYKLTFRDGSSVRACGEHLWTVHFQNHGKESTKTLTTQEWLDSPSADKYYLPQVAPVDFPEKKLPLNPYFLGSLLAQGTLNNDAIEYQTDRTEVYEKVRDEALKDGFTMADLTVECKHQSKFSHPNDNHYKNEIKLRIKALGLNTDSVSKFIPDIYKTASIKQREMLIYGLFDNSGTVHAYSRQTCASCITSSERLADDILEVLWSLGLSATKQKRIGYKHTHWSVNLFSNWNPFLAEKLDIPITGSVKPIRRSLIQAEAIKPVPMRCIEVDAPDKLYVTKDYIVTHNSTCILGRIDYMIASGIKPEDITVLSFTNAAANHISEKNPRIHSMTIAAMIHSIYEMNFPDHDLSNLDTIMNSLAIYFPQDPFADEFRRRLFRIKKNERDSFTSMNSFIEYHYDDVIRMLNTIKQTSLELEIIICYQQIDNFKEPPEVASKYLIIDEVQDNSIFEFVYTLKYVDKHKESLFIVGDCSQTLYEFRASNPKALNVLEGSGVFTTYQLQVNYRSNQEILDFANIALQNIEANQYANIQLRANSLSPVTEQSFTDAVKLSYYKLGKLADFDEALSSILAVDVKDYIEEKLNKGEKIAFLAYTRKHIALIEQILKHMFPNKNIVSIVPDRMHNSTVLSDFVKKYWDEVKFVPSQSLVTDIINLIFKKLPYITRDVNKSTPFVRKLLTEWAQEEEPNINMWTKQYINKQITLDTLLMNTKECMLHFETRHNAIKQALLSARNEETKKAQTVQNADMVLSTIHSAKGLEFDNVVVIYQNSNYLDEEKKRMYYVALTRAMKSEYVVAYDTVSSPQIQADYNTIIDAFKPKANKKNKTIKI